jgi:hypothetical protein
VALLQGKSKKIKGKKFCRGFAFAPPFPNQGKSRKLKGKMRLFLFFPFSLFPFPFSFQGNLRI